MQAKKIVIKKLFSSSYNLKTIATPVMFVTSNSPIVTCFASQSLKMKLTTMAKTSHVQLNIHRSKVQVVDKQSTNVGTNSENFLQQMASWMGRAKVDRLTTIHVVAKMPFDPWFLLRSPWSLKK
jgi:hypothetical protein